MDVATRPWTREERALWQRIETHAFENPDIDLDFTRRLARTLSWPIETARAAIEQYCRFCFLACVTTTGPVTPSEEVDEVWHLHLTYTRDYWERWCGTALGRNLHHDPTSGGPVEQARYGAQYAETLALYESYFGPPPAAFWPGTRQRFAARARYRMIDGARSLVLPRPRLRGLRLPALAGLFTLMASPRAAAASLDPLDLSGADFLLLFICLGALVALVTVLLRDRVRATGRPADVGDLSPIALAYAQGGMDRAADTLLVALAAHEAASLGSQITIGRAPRLPADLDRFRAAMPASGSRARMLAAFATSVPAVAMLEDLRRRNVLLGTGRRQAMRLAILLPVGLLIGLGLAKIAVGLSRGRPVGFLVALCVVAVVGLLVTLGRERFVTGEAKNALAAMRTRLDRAVRAPRGEEVALAVAFAGTAALSGTAYAAYGRIAGSSSGSGCGASGCGGGGGGGGGGGCGGCGS